jgi:N-acetylneuraminic acid mutarotase
MYNRYTLLISLIFCLFFEKTNAQTWRITEEIMMPEAVTNAAITEGVVGDSACVYVFGGLDSTKLYSGIHQRAYRYNTVSKKWLRLPDLPDTLGKIAAGASFLKGKIYHVGGYHVYANSDEKSSNRLHRFDCQLNTYINDGKTVPVPIDDHVQAVWRDSLIYVITGWSNVSNVANVQIYNPTTDSWLVGTPSPNTNTFKSFGASGVVFKDTIFYLNGQ